MALNINGTTGISGVDGTVSAPALTGTDSNTGITFPSADTIKFSTGGVERMSITNSGISGITAGLTMADHWRLTTTYSIPTNSTAILSTANWERPDTSNDGFGQLGTGMSVNSSDHAAGLWTFPSTGFYLVSYSGVVYNASNDPYEVLIRMEFTENGGSNFGLQSRIYGGGEVGNYNNISGQGLVDVTSTSDVKMRLRVYSANSSSTLLGNSTESRNYFTVIRLGDT